MDKAHETVVHWACKGKEENEGMVKLLLEHIKKLGDINTNNAIFLAY